MNEQNLRSIGLSLLFIGMAIGGLGRSLHVAENVKIAMSVVSGVFSVAAAVLFIKVTPAKRRPVLIAFMVVFCLVLALIGYLIARL